ncbi:hypothetical protein FE392_03030 [Xenorhabdus sp. 12]|uniref:Major facilitator superfamily (MFS) profile domain-containing protein n=1 Tax=Xenorhabdus santafensis TaxID=2582833 RepID=A0ABU4S5L5_9GAMM|nr:hypothetical protein [Xenorhabdus sp. 12]
MPSSSIPRNVSRFALAIAGSGEWFVALRILQALGASAAPVAAFATVWDVYVDRPENRIIYNFFSSKLTFVSAFGSILGSAIGGLLLRNVSCQLHCIYRLETERKMRKQ